MTYEYYINLVKEAVNGNYNSERLLAEVGYPPEITLTADSFVKAIDVIIAVSNKSIKCLVELSGLSMRAFAAKLLIPYRTMQDWCANTRKPPEYVLIMIGYILISGFSEDNVL